MGLDRCRHIPEQLSPAGPFPGTTGAMCFGDGSSSSTPGHGEGRSAAGIPAPALPFQRLAPALAAPAAWEVLAGSDLSHPEQTLGYPCRESHPRKLGIRLG